MGRRSINTTKSGKYMNPTDQARKEARKRELKKNKKQRMIVRAAVLKAKEPEQIVFELKKLDEMEFNTLVNPSDPAPFGEKVIKDKRKKLKETFERVLRLWEREDVERHQEFKRMMADYESERMQQLQYHMSVRIAQQVSIDEIPLPEMPQMPGLMIGDIPLPGQQPASILKKSETLQYGQISRRKQPPGPPMGPIPPTAKKARKSATKPDFTKPTEDDKQDLKDEFKDAESKDESIDRKELKSNNDDTAGRKSVRFAGGESDSDDSEDEDTDGEDGENMTSNINTGGLKPPGPPSGPPPSFTIRAPPGPPPGLPPNIRQPPVQPPGPPPGAPPGMTPQYNRLPPPPPPRGVPHQLPPNMVPPPMVPPPPGIMPPTLQQQQQLQREQPTVLSAPPSLINRTDNRTQMGGPNTLNNPAAITIQAKAQIVKSDVTRFMPTSLRIRREGKKPIRPRALSQKHSLDGSEISTPKPPAPKHATKDEVYETFMREMEGLI